jgi:hypothetical protein
MVFDDERIYADLRKTRRQRQTALTGADDQDLWIAILVGRRLPPHIKPSPTRPLPLDVSSCRPRSIGLGAVRSGPAQAHSRNREWCRPRIASGWASVNGTDGHARSVPRNRVLDQSTGL